jgi:GMP synthase-like glutamine amidotransferase
MTHPRLLYLINGPTYAPLSKLDTRFEDWGLQVERFWAYSNEFPTSLDGYAGIVIAGSPHGAYEDIPWIHREHELIQDAAQRGIPMLGICFGSQILASALCGRDQVFRRSSCEIGYIPHIVHPAAHTDPIASELADGVTMFTWHNDEVKANHPDMTILASTPLCPNQVWRWRDQPVWGIQGHLEIPLALAPAWIEDCRDVMVSDGADVDALIASAVDQTPAQSMLRRFATYIQQPIATR